MNECSIKIWDFELVKFPMDLKLLFLIQAMIAAGVHDLYLGRQDMVFVVGLPAVFYILGVYISKIYSRNKPIGAYLTLAVMAIITCIKGILQHGKNYSDFFLITAFLLVALITIKASRVKTIAILTVSSVVGIVFLWHQFLDGRLKVMIEAMALLLKKPCGGFNVNFNGINTSHCMWLDYANQYGIIVFSLLCIFELLTIVEAVRFARNIYIYIGDSRLHC